MIVVTGGAGFIGSALVWELNNRGITDILVVDIPGDKAKEKNLTNLSFREFLDRDEFLERVAAGGTAQDIEAILHMGACSDTTEMDEAYLEKNNTEYTKSLCTWALDNGVRFIYASSAATYGDGTAGFSDDETKLEQLQPLNPYGWSKHKFDLWAKANDLLDKIVGLKYFNVYGPNEYHKGHMRSFVVKAFEQINEKGKVSLFKSYRPEYKDGEQKRDFLYIKDAVAMTLFFLDNPAVNGLFNVGTGNARTWNDLVKAVFAAMDKPIDIEYIDMPDSIRNQYQYFTQAEVTKIRNAGYTKPITSLENAVKDYVKHYLVLGKCLC